MHPSFVKGTYMWVGRPRRDTVKDLALSFLREMLECMRDWRETLVRAIHQYGNDKQYRSSFLSCGRELLE